MRNALCCSIVISAVVLGSCSPPQPDLAGLKKTVDAYNAASTEGMLSGNTEKILTYYDDNVMEMPPNMPAIKGREAVKAFQESMSKTGMKFNKVTFTTTELQAGGKVGYEVGTYDMTITMAPMGEMQDAGKYIALWNQQADGSWKLHAEMWSSDKPMPKMGDMEQAPSNKKK
jgi:ketosteroid isomerase-like protein